MFQLSLQGKNPIYEQIRGQITQFIELGLIKPGEKLPSVRQLAQDNAINPNTVARAYQRLEEEGYIVTVPKKGAYVAEGGAPLFREAELTSVLLSYKERGVTKERMTALINEIYGKESENA